MKPDELRALADALEPMARAPRFEDFDVPAFCAWVRACADAKPVGVYVHRPAELRYGVEWLVGDPMPNGTQLFTHPAPAAPQAGPKREPNPDEVICPACTHQFRAIPENVQAQLWAKREPLSDTMVIACARVAIARIQPDEWVATDADLIDFARAIESEHGIGGSDE